MNIFYLHSDPTTCARWHCNKHVVKMVLETAQLLSSAHHATGSQVARHVYKATHVNHPCAVWVRAHAKHYRWTYRLLVALAREYTYRYGRQHATARLLPHLAIVPPIKPAGAPTPPPQCMPTAYQRRTAVAGYKAYYVGAKARMLAYKGRQVPPWVTKGVSNG